MDAETVVSKNFIEQIIEKDIAEGQHAMMKRERLYL